MKLFIEKYWPYAITLLSITLLYFLFSREQIEMLTKNTVDKAFTMSGILLGFLLTIITIIGSIETKKMKYVRQTGNYKRLQKYLHHALYSNIALLVISFLMSIIDQSCFIDIIKIILSYILISISVLTLALSIRFTLIIINLLTEEK